MERVVVSCCGVLSYIVGLAGLTAFMLYMGGWGFLPIHINSAVANSNTVQAVLVNFLILALFGLHHSIAARSRFKEKLSKIMPVALERSTYVMMSGIFMFAICFYWQPLAGTIWSTDNTTVVLMMQAIHILGWLTLVAATFEIDHFHLTGLKQSLSMSTSEGNKLKEGFLYSIVRHPIQTGILMGIWFTANMSMTQFMLSICLTLYIFVGLYYEEKSLISHFGDLYLDYKKRVPGVIPFWPTQ